MRYHYIFRPKLLPTLITLVLTSILLNLGFWQLNRAAHKTLIKTQLAARSSVNVSLDDLKSHPAKSYTYYHIELKGEYDNQHNILLDNKIRHHQLGYELFTPFYIFGQNKLFLIDRGWFAQTPDRHVLPFIAPIKGEQILSGILMPADQGGIALGQPEIKADQWPWRVQKIILENISKASGHDFYPYIIAPDDGNNSNLNMTHLKPEKHVAYAFQWFALAAALIIFYVLASSKRREK